MASTLNPEWEYESLAERLSNANTHEYTFDQIRIGVVGFKGGCGTTYLATALTVAALSAGYRVAHIVTHRECNSGFSSEFNDLNLGNSKLRIYKSIEESLNDAHFLPEFSIFDIPNQSFFGYHHYQEVEESLSWLIDVLIHPASFDSPFGHDRILTSINSEIPLPRHRRIIMPLCSSMNLFHFKKAFSELEEYSDFFTDVCFFEGEPFNFKNITHSVTASFNDDLSQFRYQKLLAESVRVAICNSMNERLYNLNPYFYELVFQR